MVEPTMSVSNRFSLRRIAGDEVTFADDVRAGLTAVQKAIPPRYFYDDLGSALFEAICELPEYYVRRAETELLNIYKRDIAAAIASARRIVELGSGSGRKTRLLLSEIVTAGRNIEYIPVDLDLSMLQSLGRELVAEYEGLTVTALACDFRRAARALRESRTDGATCIFFLGSTIGNLDPEDASAMFRDLRKILRAGDTMLVGADLKKDRAMLEAAYDDPLGVTAAFNLNLLQRMNRELAGEFDTREFAHRAIWNEEQSRIEMHLVSLREQSVHIGALGIEVAFAEGETIHTENSYKYDDESIERIAHDGGFNVINRWTDSRGWFGEYLLSLR